MRAIASGRLVGFLASFLGYLLQVVGPSSDSVCIQPLTTLPALTEAALPPWRLLAGTGTGIPRNSNSQEEGSVRHLRMYKKLPPPPNWWLRQQGSVVSSRVCPLPLAPGRPCELHSAGGWPCGGSPTHWTVVLGAARGAAFCSLHPPHPPGRVILDRGPRRQWKQ